MENQKTIRIRRILQVFFFGLIALIAVNHTLTESGRGIPFLSAASVHALCPFGGTASIYQYFVTGTFVKKIHASAFILMWLVFILTIAFGPVFCGWICPLGSIQEWIGRLGKRIFGKKYNTLIPYQYDRYVRFLRYGVLVWVIYRTAIAGTLIFANIDPYYALFHFWTGDTAIAALIVLGLTLLASLFVERFWCKYACPYGALLGIGNLFRIFKIKRNTDTCIHCKECDTACPMNIPVSTSHIVRHHQCITCMKCTAEEACPVNNTVELSL